MRKLVKEANVLSSDNFIWFPEIYGGLGFTCPRMLFPDMKDGEDEPIDFCHEIRIKSTRTGVTNTFKLDTNATTNAFFCYTNDKLSIYVYKSEEAMKSIIELTEKTVQKKKEEMESKNAAKILD